MKKIIISLIAFTASLLNLGHSQFAVHSIIDSSGAYSFNYYLLPQTSTNPVNLHLNYGEGATKTKPSILRPIP